MVELVCFDICCEVSMISLYLVIICHMRDIRSNCFTCSLTLKIASQIFSNWFSIVINSILLWHWLRLKTLSTIGLNILIETSSFSAVSVARGDGHSLQLYKLIAMLWFVSTSTNKTSFLLMIIVVVIFSSSVKHYKVWLAVIYIKSVESFKIYCDMALHSVKFRANLVLLIFHSGNFLHEKSPFF